MLIDDDADALAITKQLLELKGGYNVHAFDHPSMALEHIIQGCKDCDIVLSDVRMPGMSGFEFLKRAKELRPELKVLLASSFPIQKEEWQKVLPSTKVDGFVSKPFVTSELIDTVKKCGMQKD
jgi:response regulator RpfG family c-di-GMP phosphodiesterase